MRDHIVVYSGSNSLPGYLVRKPKTERMNGTHTFVVTPIVIAIQVSTKINRTYQDGGAS